MENKNVYRGVELYLTKVTGHTTFIIDDPIKSFREVEKKFPERWPITMEMWPKNRLRGRKIIEIVSFNCKNYSQVPLLIQIHGYTYAPVQFFLKIAYRNFNQFKRHPRIHCVDPSFLGQDRILSIDNTVNTDGPFIDGYPKSFIGNYGAEWYAVVRK